MKSFSQLLLERMLAKMGRLQARMAESILEQPVALAKLQAELEDLGWAMALLSAVGEQHPELARHHPGGLNVLFGLLDSTAQEPSQPSLAPTPGGALAWALAELSHSLECGLPQIEPAEGQWLIRFSLNSQPPPATPDWFGEQGLSLRYVQQECRLLVPGSWLIG